jgi:hypothetical protein
MRRPIAFLLAFLLSSPAIAVNYTASNDGVWSTVFGATPTAADSCTIDAGAEVTLDANGVCGMVTVNGSLVPEAAVHTLTAGQAGSGVARTSSLVVGSTGYTAFKDGDALLVDCPAAIWDNCEIRVSGYLAGIGRQVRAGRVAQVGTISTETENCSTGLHTADVALSSCNNPAIYVSAETGRLITDEFNTVAVPKGEKLIFVWPAAHHDRWYHVFDTIAPDKLLLDFNSRGQNEPEGVTFAGTASVSSATVTWATSTNGPTGFTAGGATPWTGNFAGMPVGGFWFCDADCTAASNTSPVAHNERLPCAAAKRVIANTSGTLTLESAYSGGCGSAAASHVVSVGGKVWPQSPYHERTSPGDPFVIVRPFRLSIPDANMAMAGTDMEACNAAGTCEDKHYHIIVEDGGVLDLEYAEVGFCGVGDANAPSSNFRDCIDFNYTASKGSGHGRLRFVEIHDFGGQNAIQWNGFSSAAGDLVEHLTMRDAQMTDVSGPDNLGHGFMLEDYLVAGGGADFKLQDFRCERTGDDCAYGAYGANQFDDLTIERGTIVFSSRNSELTSTQGLDWSVGAPFTGEGLIEDVIISNFDDGGIPGPTSGGPWAGGLVARTVLIQNMDATALGEGPGVLYANFKFVALNSVFRNLGSVATGAVRTTGVGSSYIEGAGRQIDGPSDVYGVVAVTPNVANTVGYQNESASTSQFKNGGPTLTDVVLIEAPTAASRGVTAPPSGSSYPVTIDHASMIGQGASSGWAFAHGGGSGAITVTNSVIWGHTYGFNSGGGPFTENHNLVLKTSIPCDPCTIDATDVLTGSLGWQSLSIPHAYPASNTTPQTMLLTAGDTSFAGARCAGPSNWDALERLYPPLASLGRPGVSDPALCADSDGDTWYDLHDSCPTDPNPLCE